MNYLSGRAYRLLLPSFCIALGLALGAAPLFAQDDELHVLAEDVTGEVEVRPPGDEWADLEAGDIVPLEADISTSFNSEAVLAVGENAVLTVEPLTRLSIDDLAEEEGVERSELALEVGRVEGDVDRADVEETEFDLHGPVATASVRGTNFTFDGERLTVVDGVVALVNRFGRERVVATGEQSATDGTDPPQSPAEERRARTRTSPYTEGGGGEASDPSPPPSDPVIDPDAPGSLVIDWETEEL